MNVGQKKHYLEVVFMCIKRNGDWNVNHSILIERDVTEDFNVDRFIEWNQQEITIIIRAFWINLLKKQKIKTRKHRNYMRQ